jgi:hypothetical protein
MSKTPYLVGGGILLAVGAYWLYTKNKAPVAAAPAAPATTPTTPATLLKTGTVASPADIAALAKLLGPTAAAPTAGSTPAGTVKNVLGLDASTAPGPLYVRGPDGNLHLTPEGQTVLTPRAAMWRAQQSSYTFMTARSYMVGIEMDGAAFPILVAQWKASDEVALMHAPSIAGLVSASPTTPYQIFTLPRANLQAFLAAMATEHEDEFVLIVE